jgi:membrane protein DedA with SNARE-associated domain
MNIYALILTYKYSILFPLAIFEGPIITIIAGFLVTLGILNPYFVYLLIVLSDVVGDSIIYSVGYAGGAWVLRAKKFFRIADEKLTKAKVFFDTHHHKTLIFSKVFHGIGIAGLLSAGILRIKYGRYVLVCAGVSVIQSAILLILGIMFGHLYVQIEKYLNFFAASISVIVAFAILVLVLYKTRQLSVLGK